jgi:hypothetical protein
LRSESDHMENVTTENELANQKIEVYIAIKEIINSGRPVTMYGISMLTGLSTSYIWINFALKGNVMKMIEDAEQEKEI